MIFNVGRDIEYDLRNDLFAHLERLPLAYYQTQQTGDLMSRLVNDITAVRMLLGVGFLCRLCCHEPARTSAPAEPSGGPDTALRGAA